MSNCDCFYCRRGTPPARPYGPDHLPSDAMSLNQRREDVLVAARRLRWVRWHQPENLDYAVHDVDEAAFRLMLAEGIST